MQIRPEIKEKIVLALDVDTAEQAKAPRRDTVAHKGPDERVDGDKDGLGERLEDLLCLDCLFHLEFQ